MVNNNVSIERPKRKCSIQPTGESQFEELEARPRKLRTSSPALNNRKSCPPGDTFPVVPLRISIPEEDNCKLSNDLADSCRTLCKVCGNSVTLTGMRSHTMNQHELQITRYKELYGPFEIIEQVFHKCHLCGKILLLDSDAMGGHIKGTHKMKEKEYKERFMTYSHQSTSKVESKASNVTSKKKSNIFSSKSKPQYDFKTTFTDYEYSCNLKHCELCEHEGVEVILDTIDSSEVKSEVEETEKTIESNSVATDISEDLVSVEESCNLGQGGWSKKFLPTDILASKEIKGDEEIEFFNSESIDYSDESLIEESESSSESSEDDSEEE